jgi:hypothetical protein
MTQYARPTSDISNNSWTDEGPSFNDGNLYTSIQEVSQDGDTSYLNSTGDAGTFEVKLGTISDPEVGTGHIVHIYARGTGSGGPERLAVYLYEGTTLIETLSTNWAPGRGSYSDLNFTLVLADDIADYTDLRIRVTVASIGGSEQLDITQIYLETTDAAAGQDDLDAVGITADPVVGTPTIGQIHVLLAVAIIIASVLGIPSIGQTQVLDSVDITANPVLGTPVLGIAGDEFPTTGILDDFNRDDEGPPPSADWASVYNGHEVIGNACWGIEVLDDNVSVWDKETFGPGVEMFLTSNHYPRSVALYILEDGSVPGDGYQVWFDGFSDTVYLFRVDELVEFELDSISQQLAIGDKFGIAITSDGHIQAWHDDGGGWVKLMDEIDTTYQTNAWGLTPEIYNTDGSFDDFGGGELVTGGVDNLSAVGISTTPIIGTPTIGQTHVLTSVGITADPVLGIPTLTRVSNLTAVDITADPVVGTPTIGQIHALDSVDITADPVVGTPVLGTEGEDNLVANGITVNPVLDTPTIGQTHVLASIDISAAPVLDTPTVIQIVDLTATDITANPVLGTPALAQVHALVAVDITADPVLDTPTVGRISNLTATDITANPVLGTPALAQVHALVAVDITANPVLGTPVLGSEGEDNLEAIGITADPVVGNPAIGQIHELSSVGISTSPMTGTPTLTIVHILNATSIITTPVVEESAIGQTHALSSTEIYTTPVTGTPTLSHIHELNAISITVTPIVEIPSIGQTHILDATTIVVSPILSVSVIGQTHILSAIGITTTPELGVASFELVEGIAFIVFSAYQPEVTFDAYQPEVSFTISLED